jgi:hypothetical protein
MLHRQKQSWGKWLVKLILLLNAEGFELSDVSMGKVKGLFEAGFSPKEALRRLYI